MRVWWAGGYWGAWARDVLEGEGPRRGLQQSGRRLPKRLVAVTVGCTYRWDRQLWSVRERLGRRPGPWRGAEGVPPPVPMHPWAWGQEDVGAGGCGCDH